MSNVRAAFTLKPFARQRIVPRTSKSFDRSFDTSVSESAAVSSPARETVLRVPQTGQEVGKVSLSAAREGVVSEKFWRMMTDRTLMLTDDIEPQDVAYLLNGMSRVRAEISLEFLKKISPQIEQKLAYFSSIHLAMTIASLSKYPLCHSSPLVERLVDCVGGRMHEFSTPLELSMVVGALARLKLTEKQIWARLATVVQTKMDQHKSIFFPMRELVLVVSAFSNHYRDVSLFEKFREQAICQISEATPAELGRLVSVFGNTDELSLLAERSVWNKLKYTISPPDLVACVLAWPPKGNIHEFLFTAFLSSFPLFQLRQTAEILTFYSRWKLHIPPAQLAELEARLSAVRMDRYDDLSLLMIVSSGFFGPIFLQKNSSKIFQIIASPDAVSDHSFLIRAINVYLGDPATRPELQKAVAELVLKKKLDKRTQNTLRELLVKFLPADDDLILVLSGS